MLSLMIGARTYLSTPRLSKSRFTSFLACPRLGYLRAFPSRFAAYCEVDAGREALFAMGTRVGELARKYYPGGLLISADHLHIPDALRQTRHALAAGSEVIYEAAVQYQNILVRADILRRLHDGTFELTEVKSATKLDQSKHIPDVAIQLFVLASAGIPVSRAHLMHLNRDYVHPGGHEYDPRALFVAEDVTCMAEEYVDTILPTQLSNITTWLRADEPPDIEVKNACRSCEYFQAYCRPRSSPFPVSELGPADTVIAHLKAAGITDLRTLRADSLEFAQLVGLLRSSVRAPRILRMLDAVRSGELRVATGPALTEALAGLIFPLHFLDFESWNPPLPVFTGTRPYEHIPFQWSDHRLWLDGKIDHAEHLAEGEEDPRHSVADTLVRRFADQGSVFAYHAIFERDRLRDLACLFPSLESQLLDIADRLVDLETLVADHLYHPDFHGSFSLKSVLPVLVPGSSYESLAIGNGTEAALAYEQLRQLPPGPDSDQLRSNMLAYCAQDTAGMVEIYRLLRQIA